MAIKTPINVQDVQASPTELYVERHPGVAEIERLFPSPVAQGKGSMALEGGVSVVGGPGMGKTTLFTQLAAKLHQGRGLTTAVVRFPAVESFSGEAGFYPFLGELIVRICDGLKGAREPSIVEALLEPPGWDGPHEASMTPRGFERFVTRLAQAGVHTPGICLLFDDVDQVGTAPWKGPLISALRFVFQTSSGITPIYALWTLFGDESLPGSNYFRNVTRPVFLEPLDLDGRVELITAGLPNLSLAAKHAVARLGGGHPLLLHRVVRDLAQQLRTPEQQAALAPENLNAAITNAQVAEQRDLVSGLLARSGALATALSDLRRARLAYATLPRGVVASGLVDCNDDGIASLVGRVLDVVP